MSKIKKLSLVALVLIVVGAAGCLLTFEHFKQLNPVHKEKVVESSFSKVELNSGNVRIDIQPTADQAAKVVLAGQESYRKDIDFTADVKEDTLDIKVSNHHINFFDLDFFTHQLALTVYLPKKQYESIHIQNDNGKMQAENIDTKTLVASTDNGLINLKNIPSEKVKLHTDNGRITMTNVSGDLKGDTNNGEIQANLKDLDRAIDLSCDNGRITIQTDEEPTNARFDVHVDNGRVNILNKYNGNAVIGNGDNLIKLSTDNGSINVTK